MGKSNDRHSLELPKAPTKKMKGKTGERLAKGGSHKVAPFHVHSLTMPPICPQMKKGSADSPAMPRPSARPLPPGLLPGLPALLPGGGHGHLRTQGTKENKSNFGWENHGSLISCNFRNLRIWLGAAKNKMPTKTRCPRT